MSHLEWILLVYRVPTEPASRRVTIWRDLKRMGALYLQQCVCILPRRDDLVAELERTTTKLTGMGGEYTRFALPSLPSEDEAKIIASFRALRDKEYMEIVEECASKFVREIEFERFRENYTFEEAEEIGQDLEKIRRWFRKVKDRDWFEAEGRETVETWIQRCQVLLDQFEEDVYRLAGDDAEVDNRHLIATGPTDAVPPNEAIDHIMEDRTVAPANTDETITSLNDDRDQT